MRASRSKSSLVSPQPNRTIPSKTARSTAAFELARVVIRWIRTRNFKRNDCDAASMSVIKLRGTSEQPRVCINRTLKHFSCQVVDDLSGKTLVSASTRDKVLRSNVGSVGGNCDAAAVIGKAIAEKASAAGIKRVRLDRGTQQVPRSGQGVRRGSPRGWTRILISRNNTDNTSLRGLNH